MFVNGSDCSIVIKTSHLEKDIPFSDETIREAVSFLQEEAAIEGDGVCRGIRKSTGVKGCVVTPLTIGTAPLLLYLAMGSAGNPLFVSETRNLYQYQLNLLPMEDTECFDLVQDRWGISSEQLAVSSERGERRLYEGCRVQGFELRILRGEAIKLKLDVCGDCPPKTYPYTDTAWGQASEMNDPMRGRERFNSDFVTYTINGKEYKNIYGITVLSKKVGGTRTEIWIKRALQKSGDIPDLIDELIITAQLLRDNYELRQYGTFRITLKRLVMISDETEVNATGAVISPLRYYVAGNVSTEVFTSGEEIIP
jgi:hypothetical protein